MIGVLGLRLISLSMGGAALTLALLYVGPPELVRRDGVGPQATLVQIIDDIIPVFPLLFAASATLIVVSLIRQKGVVIAHACAAMAWMFYGLLLLFGALLLEPPAPILTGTISIWASVMHWGMARAWADQGVR